MRNKAAVIAALQAGDTDAYVRDVRVRALFSPYFFVKVVLNNPDVVEHFHGRELERFVERMHTGQFRQWIEWPRGHFKTTCFTIGLGVWFVLPWNDEDVQYAVEVLGMDEYVVRRRLSLHNQDLAQLLAFENSDNARMKMSEIRTHFEQNMLFRAAFPEIAYVGTEKPWNDESIKIRRTPAGFQTGEGTFDAIGVGGALQSRHYDIVWGDDLVGKAATESPSVMESTIRWFGLLNGALRGRARGAQSCIFGVSNRWGYYDLNSEVQKSGQFLFHRRAVTEFDEEKGRELFVFPERFTDKVLEEIRNSPGMNRYDFQCTPTGSPILMADWSDRPIEQVKVGDEVIGWDRSEGRPKLVRSKVLAVGSSDNNEIIRLHMDSGQKVLCTPDHLWANGMYVSNSGKPEFQISKPGRILWKICDPMPDDSQNVADMAWLSGIIDGEGTINPKMPSCLSIAQSESHNPQVHEKIEKTLHRLGIKFSTYGRAAFEKFGKHSKSSTLFILHGGRDLKRRLYHNGYIAKRHKIIENLWSSTKRIGQRDKILQIEPVGTGTVHWLQTETGNYISQGYASKNCQYYNNPLAPGDNEVDVEMVHRYTVDPTGLIRCSCGESVLPSDLLRFMHFDPYNAKGVRSTSAPAIAVVGTSTTKHVYLLDYFISRGDYSKIYDQLVRFNDTWWPEVFTYEDVGNQNMCEFYLKELQKTAEFKEKGHKRFRLIKAASTRGKSKEVRVRDALFPVIEQGRLACRSSQKGFIQMLETWPHRVEGHDYDLLDALAQGPAVWRYPLDEEMKQQYEGEEAAALAQLGKTYGYVAQ